MVFNRAVPLLIACLGLGISGSFAAEKTRPPLSAQEAEQCAENLGSPREGWEQLLSAALRVPTPSTRYARIRWAAIEFLFNQRATLQTMEPPLLKLLERIRDGDVLGALEAPEFATYRELILNGFPQQSLFLKRMDHQALRQGPPEREQKSLKDVLSYKPKQIGELERFAMRAHLLGQKFSRWDDFVTEMESFPRSKDRLEVFLTSVKTLGLLTWPEALEAIALIEGQILKHEAIHAVQSQIFTSPDLYQASILEPAKAHLSSIQYSESKDFSRGSFWRQWTRRVGGAALGTALVGGIVGGVNEYDRPERIAARQQAAETQRAQEMRERSEKLAVEVQHNAQEHRRALALISEAVQPWKEMQAKYTQQPDIEPLIALARAATDEHVREQLAVQYAAPLAPLLTIAQYNDLIDGWQGQTKHRSEIKSLIASPVVRYDLWVHYVQANKQKLTLAQMVEVLKGGLSQEPPGIGIDRAEIYGDYVLSHPEKNIGWWEESILAAPDRETGDNLALAYIRANAQTLPSQDILRIANHITNPTIRDRALGFGARPGGVETPALKTP